MVICNPKRIVAICYFLFFLLGSIHISWSQSRSVDLQQLSAVDPAERPRYLHGLKLENLDSAAFLATYNSFYKFAEDENDWRMLWDLRFYYFLQRDVLQSNAEDNIRLLTELEAIAIIKKFKPGEFIAKHFLYFEKHYADQLSIGALYTHLLREFEQIEVIGDEKLVDYDLEWVLYRNGRFMYKLGDLENALLFLKKAEQFIEPTLEGAHAYILVLNHLQAVYQQQNKINQGLAYAQKILDFATSVETDDLTWQQFFSQWQGLSSSDIAAMLIQQGKFEEGEEYARRSFELARSTDTADIANPTIEYDALQVLVSIKLKMRDLEGASSLLHRLDELYDQVGGHYNNYFNNIEYYECRARFHELKGEFAEAIHFSKLAEPLKDSLERRNDARHLEQLKQRLEAEKYNERIRQIEQEREFQKWLRNAVLAILLLTLLAAYLYFRQLNQQRRQQKAALEAAKEELRGLTQSFREKSAMAENLRLEIEALARAGQKSEYLEKLTSSTILTDEDWLRFRQVFEKVHPGYIEAQKVKYPRLTPAELRYLTLEKLQLSTNEMANMLGVSSSAVRKARGRMRNKRQNH